MILFSIIVDLYWRDRRTPGLIKAIWVIFLIILSYVTALVYLTFEGRAWPSSARSRRCRQDGETDEYIREAAGCSPAPEIADAKTLLDAGTITQQEFDSLKAKALSQT